MDIFRKAILHPGPPQDFALQTVQQVIKPEKQVKLVQDENMLLENILPTLLHEMVIYARATTDLLKDSPPAQGESSLIREAESEPPHKVDENMWKNREQIEEILFLLEAPHWPRALQQRSTVEDEELASVLGRLQDKFKSTLQTLESFQARNSEFVFNTVMTYVPQDFRGTIIRQQKERSERNRQAVIDALVSSGGSIHDKYAMLWKQQMDRRKQLAELGSATGVYKTMMKYLVGVPEVLMA